MHLFSFYIILVNCTYLYSPFNFHFYSYVAIIPYITHIQCVCIDFLLSYFLMCLPLSRYYHIYRYTILGRS